LEAALWGFLGALAGAGASIVTTWLSNRHSARMQGLADSSERVERARAFQRENLLSLQETLQIAMRFNARAMLEDEKGFKRLGEWGKSFLSDEVDEGVRSTNAKLMALTERVSDDSLRSAIKDFTAKATVCHMAATREQARACHDDAIFAFEPLMEHLGRVLRTLY
jgi:hypothetical protein